MGGKVILASPLRLCIFNAHPPPCGTLYYLAMLVRAPLPMSRGAFGCPPPHEAVAREFLDLKEGKVFNVEIYLPFKLYYSTSSAQLRYDRRTLPCR